MSLLCNAFRHDLGKYISVCRHRDSPKGQSVSVDQRRLTPHACVRELSNAGQGDPYAICKELEMTHNDTHGEETFPTLHVSERVLAANRIGFESAFPCHGQDRQYCGTGPDILNGTFDSTAPLVPTVALFSSRDVAPAQFLQMGIFPANSSIPVLYTRDFKCIQPTAS